ncbi:DUF732 domain-containing protein [Rhodococcoides corynebacterioides]|uniref:DUF732 domain-containing protein n=1 Tax=Rhodococcoides corynebacterioides TaxID=53972 RepID=UPI0027E02954|nr:DUF732 domain-containing protein [Rhodococcus corynebacterioides]MBY6351438.1 DUF732 domain-containing protein [Rhodococcus corynebacterioides]
MTSRVVSFLAPVLLATAAGALLTACGGDDSSASSTPTPSASTTAEAQATGEAPSATSSGAATTTSGAATSGSAAEEQEAVPSGYPGPTEVPRDPRSDAFLDRLRADGVTVAGNGDIAIGTANYICAAQSEGVAADQISTFVTANVGAEASASGTEISAEDAAATAQKYIDAARSTYCG